MNNQLKDIKKLIPLSWKKSKRVIVEGLIDIAFNEGRIYEMKGCIKHTSKEVDDAK